MKATCVLHNMLQMRGIPVPPPQGQVKASGTRPLGEGEEVEDEDIHDGILRRLGKLKGRPPLDRLSVREAFKKYFVSGVGSVPWQYDNLMAIAK
jgi:hypothetical protein